MRWRHHRIMHVKAGVNLRDQCHSPVLLASLWTSGLLGERFLSTFPYAHGGDHSRESEGRTPRLCCSSQVQGTESTDSLHTHWLTSLHHASFLHSLLNLFEETQMSQIWVQQTYPDQQAEPFLTVSLIHSAPLLLSLCLSVSAGRLAPLCLCLPGLFIPHLIPCLRFSCCPAQSCSVPWEADP